MTVDDPAALREIMRAARTIAVVGHSDKPWRPSYDVADYLRRVGYTVYAVNPTCGGRIGEWPCYPDLASLPSPIDIVDVFRRPEHVPDVVEQAIACGAKVVWLQLGVIHAEAARAAEAAGLQVVMDHCLAADHRRMMRA